MAPEAATWSTSKHNRQGREHLPNGGPSSPTLPADPSTVELFGINPGSEGTLYDCRVPCYDYNDHSAVDLMVRRSCFLDVMQSNYHDYLVPAFSYCHCQFHYHYY